MDGGVTTFMIISTALVFFMTPGLAFFYGGLASQRNIISIMLQTFVSIGITTILWFAFGYSLCFSGGEGAIIGDFQKIFLQGVSPNSLYSGNGKFPELVFMAYQLMFAIITPALITGAFLGRMTFKAYIVFLVIWQVLVYYPFVHMVWGGGLLAEWGVLDFAGGIVVHATAGFGALASVIYIKRRKNTELRPNSIPLVALGTGMLWFGWFGFNAGSELDVDGITGLAFFNTHLSAAVAATVWMIIEWSVQAKRPTLIGFCTGAVAGLATITPAAGFVSMGTAAIIGIAAGIGCYLAVQLKNKLQLDDALDVWGVHGMGGVFGTIALALAGSKAINPNGADGLFNGGTDFFLTEMGALIGASVYAFIISYGLLVVINKFTPVRVDERTELKGLDNPLHGEIAYDEGI